MALRISNTSGTFDLSKDFSTEIEDSSPIYNERGSQSIAATIPGTKKNLRLNKYINRPDIDNAPVTDARISIADGIYHRIGKMNTVKASKNEGITFNVGFGESELYSLWNDIPLNSLNLPLYKPQGGMDELYSYINDIFQGKNKETPFAVFPISVSHLRKEGADYHEYINKYDDGKIKGEARSETFIINGDLVQTAVPAGYGLSPFLKVSYIIEAIFSNYGYTVVENPFNSHHQLKCLVVLNNAADCCVKGEIKYADLMPGCTINEFFQSLWCRFGLLYFVDGNTRTVRLKFIRDIIKAKPSNDWTLQKASGLIINYEAPQQLKLSAATNIKDELPYFSAETAAESLDKFLKPYNYIVSLKGPDKGYITYDRERALYYKIDNVTRAKEFLSTSFFSWDRGADLPYKEITSIDEFLPSTLDNAWPRYINLPLYLVGKVHRYTMITSSDVELKEKLDTETPLCFCFAFHKDIGLTEGRSICLDTSGEPLIDYDKNKFDISILFVGKYGLFNHFWKEYDAILRHANHVIEADMHLSANQRMNPDFSSPILLDGQRLLSDTIRYTLPQSASSPTKVKFRTIKLLKPYDLDKEQTVPIVDQLYQWILIDNKSSVLEASTAEQIRQWRIACANEGGNLYDLQYNNETTDTTDIKIPLTVPTEEDYNSQKEYFIRKANYSFDLYYRMRKYTGTGPNGQLYYEISEPRPKNGVHFDVQYDQSVRAGLL